MSVVNSATDRRRAASFARHGDTGWGFYGSLDEHEAYVQPLDTRFRCPFCPGERRSRPRTTHSGMCNGVAMTDGCEWHMRQWARGHNGRLRRGS